MPKVKIPRKNISLDMTAMCDMAFLLLTFFMLATKFKPQEVVPVDIPSSVSPIKLPDTDMMIISVRKDGAIFFGLDGQHSRLKLLDGMAGKYNMSFTEAERQQFSLMESFGVPITQLKAYLNMRPDARNKVKLSGIPADSVDNQLKDWIYYSRYANYPKKLRIAIKGDRQSNYEVMEKVIATLQDQNINKFNLITSLEKRPN
jgi:biopolymer transport protein ExbD